MPLGSRDRGFDQCSAYDVWLVSREIAPLPGPRSERRQEAESFVHPAIPSHDLSAPLTVAVRPLQRFFNKTYTAPVPPSTGRAEQYASTSSR